MNAALTGHKLLSTLHTNNAATTIPRLLDMGVEPFLLASTLIVTVSQRLMRRVCGVCKKEKMFTREEIAESLDEQTLALLFGKRKKIKITDVKGCAACNNTGYLGRVGIYEVLEVTEAIQKAIIKRSSSEDIERIAVGEGMTMLMENGVEKVLSGETTIEELVRVMHE